MADAPVRGRRRANEKFLAAEFFTDILQGLREGRSVTRYVLEPMRAVEGDNIEFEIVVTRVGKLRVPRVTEAMASKARGQHGR